MGCVLCDSLVNERDRILYQDPHIFVLINVEPIKDGHVMILPIRHAENLKDLTAEEAQAFLKAIDRCMLALTEAYEETPMCLMNGWKYRTQSHLHVHVLPSKKNLRGLYSASEGLEERRRANNEMITRVADKLKSFFAQKF